MTNPTTDLNEGLRQAASTTSPLWDHIHIEQGSQDNMFHIVEVHICGGGAHEHSDASTLAANAKSAARKVINWLVNGDTGLKPILHPSVVTTALIKRPSEGGIQRATLLGRHIVVNDYIDPADQDIWGLNLSPDGLPLWATEDGMRQA